MCQYLNLQSRLDTKSTEAAASHRWPNQSYQGDAICSSSWQSLDSFPQLGLERLQARQQRTWCLGAKTQIHTSKQALHMQDSIYETSRWKCIHGRSPAVCKEGPTSFADTFLYALNLVTRAARTPPHPQTFHWVLNWKARQGAHTWVISCPSNDNATLFQVQCGRVRMRITTITLRVQTHTNGSCKKLASQAGQDLTHLAKQARFLQDLASLWPVFLHICKIMSHARFLQDSTIIMLC